MQKNKDKIIEILIWAKNLALEVNANNYFMERVAISSITGNGGHFDSATFAKFRLRLWMWVSRLTYWRVFSKHQVAEQ